MKRTQTELCPESELWPRGVEQRREWERTGSCPACRGGPMFQWLTIEPDPCAGDEANCTPIGCDRCMPSVRSPCLVCGVFWQDDDTGEA